MAFRFLMGRGSEPLERIEAKVQSMLEHDREEFDLAMSALLGEVVASEVNSKLRSTDQKVNQLEREIRRELVIHASVLGRIETPAVLVFMSIVKDIERIGDYAKNLLDLGLDGADFSREPDADEWRDLTRRISQYMSDVGTAFAARDGERARPLLNTGGDMLGLFDDRVSALVRGEADGHQMVARALAFRYLKRVVAHLMNVLSAVVMPVDRLDYFDEDPEDR
ncbi:phosphate signaling complex protein PhoU [soil metagenome]